MFRGRVVTDTEKGRVRLFFACLLLHDSNINPVTKAQIHISFMIWLNLVFIYYPVFNIIESCFYFNFLSVHTIAPGLSLIPIVSPFSVSSLPDFFIEPSTSWFMTSYCEEGGIETTEMKGHNVRSTVITSKRLNHAVTLFRPVVLTRYQLVELQTLVDHRLVGVQLIIYPFLSQKEI